MEEDNMFSNLRRYLQYYISNVTLFKGGHAETILQATGKPFLYYTCGWDHVKEGVDGRKSFTLGL